MRRRERKAFYSCKDSISIVFEINKFSVIDTSVLHNCTCRNTNQYITEEVVSKRISSKSEYLLS